MIFSTFLFFLDFARFYKSRSDSNFLTVKDFLKDLIPDEVEMFESPLIYLDSFFPF
jgi:hypothetical protein